MKSITFVTAPMSSQVLRHMFFAKRQAENHLNRLFTELCDAARQGNFDKAKETVTEMKHPS